MVLFFINPITTSYTGLALFYASLFFALAGTLAIFSYLARLLFVRHASKTEKVQISFRQAIFFAIVIVGSLFLQANNLMTWLNTVLLVALVTFVEFLILSFKKEPENNQAENHNYGESN